MGLNITEKDVHVKNVEFMIPYKISLYLIQQNADRTSCCFSFLACRLIMDEFHIIMAKFLIIISKFLINVQTEFLLFYGTLSHIEAAAQKIC